MSEQRNHPTVRGRNLKWIAFALLAVAAGLAGLFLWFSGMSIGYNDPLFRGKPESEWVKNLKYSDEAQEKEWRAYGEEGVQVLIRGLERASRPVERAYRRIYRRSPGFLARWLPSPKPDSTGTRRRCLASLLGSLGVEAKSATSIMSETLVRDEDAHTRALAICFFISSQVENFEKGWLNKLSAEEKLALLPLFVRALRDSSSEVRFHAAVALRFYSEQSQIIAPALLRALNDPATYARLRIADTLNKINPSAAKKANVVAVVAPLLWDPDWSVALGAAKFLGQCPQDSQAAIVALRDGLKSTNDYVVFESVWSSLQYEAERTSVAASLEEVSKANATVERALNNSKRRLRLELRTNAEAKQP